ncbi:hypothetical protein CIHG_08340 [Coccidioides immitis H538.4]|uniref:Uncharacterized protein n=1 Tax=Coccidioides immitis H538.4 TaxID=396776 RepID=A0A0J8S0Y5_COCIT|nr:hypothetical protein CIHG_08340 [Coccidioides immitis H538.4]
MRDIDMVIVGRMPLYRAFVRVGSTINRSTKMKWRGTTFFSSDKCVPVMMLRKLQLKPVPIFSYQRRKRYSWMSVSELGRFPGHCDLGLHIVESSDIERMSATCLLKIDLDPTERLTSPLPQGTHVEPTNFESLGRDMVSCRCVNRRRWFAGWERALGP